MSFDMGTFNAMMIPTVVAACLIMGYILKQWMEDIHNKFIPTALAVFGMVLACVLEKDITVELMVSGAFSGLASTGLHQAFKQLLKNDDTEN